MDDVCASLQADGIAELFDVGVLTVQEYEILLALPALPVLLAARRAHLADKIVPIIPHVTTYLAGARALALAFATSALLRVQALVGLAAGPKAMLLS